jgi:hypothetical protein
MVAMIMTRCAVVSRSSISSSLRASATASGHSYRTIRARARIRRASTESGFVASAASAFSSAI